MSLKEKTISLPGTDWKLIMGDGFRIQPYLVHCSRVAYVFWGAPCIQCKTKPDKKSIQTAKCIARMANMR